MVSRALSALAIVFSVLQVSQAQCHGFLPQTIQLPSQPCYGFTNPLESRSLPFSTNEIAYTPNSIISSIPSPSFGCNTLTIPAESLTISTGDFTPAFVTVNGDNLEISGNIAVSGSLPFSGSVAFNGAVPSGGQASVLYNTASEASLTSAGLGQGLAANVGVFSGGVPNANVCANGFVNSGNVQGFGSVLPGGIQNVCANGFVNSGNVQNFGSVISNGLVNSGFNYKSIGAGTCGCV